MTTYSSLPLSRRALPWVAGGVVGALVWGALMVFLESSGAFAIYVGIILGFNAYAYTAAGIARPLLQDEGSEEDGWPYMVPRPDEPHSGAGLNP